MKDSKGRGVVRLGDRTSHGGQVISATDSFTVRGKQVALDGDTTFCPQCKGTFPIKAGASERRHHGTKVAYHGDATGCGATLVSTI